MGSLVVGPSPAGWGFSMGTGLGQPYGRKARSGAKSAGKSDIVSSCARLFIKAAPRRAANMA
jgi:hypothetical protein